MHGQALPQPFHITYTASDAAGNVAGVNRTVTVADPCQAPAEFCIDSSTCYPYGICLPAVTSVPEHSQPPNITLRTATVRIPQFSTYTACSPGQKPALTAPCEPGATATSYLGTDLTSEIVACPPAACAATQCQGERIAGYAQSLNASEGAAKEHATSTVHCI